MEVGARVPLGLEQVKMQAQTSFVLSGWLYLAHVNSRNEKFFTMPVDSQVQTRRPLLAWLAAAMVDPMSVSGLLLLLG